MCMLRSLTEPPIRSVGNLNDAKVCFYAKKINNNYIVPFYIIINSQMRRSKKILQPEDFH